MAEYIALIHKDSGSAFGASFPDLPGCISLAGTLEELRPSIEESLGLHIEGMIEDGEAVPEPSSFDEIVKSKDYADAVAVMAVRAPELPGATVRVNITLPEKTLAQSTARRLSGACPAPASSPKQQSDGKCGTVCPASFHSEFLSSLVGQPDVRPSRNLKEPAMPAFRTLNDVDVRGKRVVIRVDLNVPVANGVVTDATRIERVAPTIRELLEKGAAVIVLAHFERPKGKVVPEMSLKPVASALEKIVAHPVKFIFTDWQSRPEVDAKPGDLILMENTRYHGGEEKNDAAFATMLAGLGDIFVNDAFSAAHRAHSSTEGIAHIIPAYAGRAMEAELKALQLALENPKRPVVAIVGGAKVSTKLDLLGNLVKKVDALVIGGAMANTFLLAQGAEIGKSLAERDLVETARAILKQAEAAQCAIVLPVDAEVANELKEGVAHHTYGVDALPREGMILDVGALSVARINAVIDDAHTLLWNGPLGAFETKPFDAGTLAVAIHAANRTKAKKLVSVAGGGDTVSALNHAGVAKDFTYISTAGGAFLEWLEGKALPGVKALEI